MFGLSHAVCIDENYVGVNLPVGVDQVKLSSFPVKDVMLDYDYVFQVE